MKKYALLGVLILGSILLNVYVENIQEVYLQTKYGVPTLPILGLISIFFNITYLLYLYISILQFDLMKQTIVIRIGHKRYNSIISKLYITQCLGLMLANFLIDYVLFKQVFLVENLMNIALLLILLLIFRKKKQVLDSVLVVCIIALLAMKYLIFLSIRS